MPRCLLDLPFDIVHQVVRYLNCREYSSLSLVNKLLHRYLEDDKTAKACIQNNFAHGKFARNVPQAAQTSGVRKQLWIHHLRREACRRAKPYSVSILAYATSFIFTDGQLCYSTSSAIRVLDLASQGKSEKVIDVEYFARVVARLQVPSTSSLPSLRSTQVLGIKSDIITVLCDFETPSEKWLFAVNVGRKASRNRCLLAERLRSSNKLFACHNAEYLYYGTQSAMSQYGRHEWYVHGFDLKTGQSVTNLPIHFDRFTGSDLGANVCFTIHEGCFYALSNQTSYESQEVNWTSYYHYISFPLDSAQPDLSIRTIFRRQDAEGPINDAWTDLHFETDDETGDLMVIEARKEWLNGSSSSTRTWYVEPWSQAHHGEWTDQQTFNPHDQVSRTLESSDESKYEEFEKVRVPKYCHREGGRREYLRAKTKFSAYDYNIGGAVEIVVDEVQSEGWRKKDRARLRVVGRLAASPLEHGRLRARQIDKSGDAVADSEFAFRESEVFLWPADEDAGKWPEAEELMCPGGRMGEVRGALGEEGVVYTAGNAVDGKAKSLVYVSFDPTFGFEGIKRLDGDLAVPRRRRACGSRASSSGKKRSSSHGDDGSPKRARTADGMSFGEHGVPDAPALSPGRCGSSEVGVPGADAGTTVNKRLLWSEAAQYSSIRRGFWLR